MSLPQLLAQLPLGARTRVAPLPSFSISQAHPSFHPARPPARVRSSLVHSHSALLLCSPFEASPVHRWRGIIRLIGGPDTRTCMRVSFTSRLQFCLLFPLPSSFSPFVACFRLNAGVWNARSTVENHSDMPPPIPHSPLHRALHRPRTTSQAQDELGRRIRFRSACLQPRARFSAFQRGWHTLVHYLSSPLVRSVLSPLA